MSRRIILLFLFNCALFLQSRTQTIVDIDGNSYQSIQIGNQNWLSENLKVQRFRNGDSIQTAIGAVINDTNAIYQWAFDMDTANVSPYGRLYTYFAAIDPRGICPLGWHVPSEEEWDTLVSFAGGSFVAGNHLKDSGTTYWDSTTQFVDNSSGFSARGSGFRGNPQDFNRLGKGCSFWSSDSVGPNQTFPRGRNYSLSVENTFCFKGVATANFGASIRCIQDQNVGLQESMKEDKFLIYPNPSESNFSIHFQEKGNYDVAIFDSQGKMLQEYTNTTQNRLEIDLNVANGVYFISFHSRKGQWIEKVVIQSKQY